MYFHYGDPVSIHTLVAAAYNVVRDVNTKRGGSLMMMKDMLFDQVKPEMHSEFRALINKSENFFKHADRDHDSTLDFNPDETDLFIFDACSKYWELSGENPPLVQIYRGWFMVTHAYLFKLTAEMSQQMSKAKGATEGGRTSYFNLMLPLVMKSGV